MAQVLIIGATGGIGAALVALHRGRGDRVTGLSRVDGMDLTDPAAVDRYLNGIGPFDRVVVATGILAPDGGGPEKSLGQIQPDQMAQVMAINAIGPALILGRLPRLMPRDRAVTVGVLSARVGSIGDNRLGGWHSYRASKAALNMIIRGAAIEWARSHPRACLVALHPGTVATPFSAAYAGRHPATPPADTAAYLAAVMDGLTPSDSGTFRDWQGATVPW